MIMLVTSLFGWIFKAHLFIFDYEYHLGLPIVSNTPEKETDFIFVIPYSLW